MTNNRYKILLVEDETNIRLVVTTLLESADTGQNLRISSDFMGVLSAGSGDPGFGIAGSGWHVLSSLAASGIVDTGDRIVCPQ